MELFDLEDFIQTLERTPVDHSIAHREDLPINGEIPNIMGFLLEEHVRDLFRNYCGVALLEPPYPIFDGDYNPGFKVPGQTNTPCRQPESWSSRPKYGHVLRHLRCMDGKTLTEVVDLKGQCLAEFDVIADLPDRYVIGESKFVFVRLHDSLINASKPLYCAGEKKRLIAPFLPDNKPIEYWFLANSELIYGFADLEAQNKRFAMTLSNFQSHRNRLLRLNADFNDYKALVDIISGLNPNLIHTIQFPELRREMFKKYVEDPGKPSE